MTTAIEVALARAMAKSGEARAIRERARLSLADVGTEVDVHPATLCRWENGEVRPRAEPGVRWYRFMRQLRDAFPGQDPRDSSLQEPVA